MKARIRGNLNPNRRVLAIRLVASTGISETTRLLCGLFDQVRIPPAGRCRSELVLPCLLEGRTDRWIGVNEA
jgi:hypothetical protein